jgi:uncharacterized protein YijF (DUF1287 family)
MGGCRCRRKCALRWTRTSSGSRRATCVIGDVVWMRFEKEPQHLGIVGDYVHGGLSLIHAYNGAGVNRVVEHRLDDTWRARIVAAWRYPGVEA